MKRSIFIILLTSLSAAPWTFAKGKQEGITTGATYGMARFDLNQSGTLEEDEKAAIRKAFAEGDVAARMLDTNKNGILEESEIDAIKLPTPPHGKKKKKE